MDAVPRVADLQARTTTTGRTHRAAPFVFKKCKPYPLPHAERLYMVVRKALAAPTPEEAASTLAPAPALARLRHIKPPAVMRAVEEIVSALIEERTSEQTARAVVDTLYRAGMPGKAGAPVSHNRAVLRARDGTSYHGAASINGLLKDLWAPNDTTKHIHLAKTDFFRATWLKRARVVEVVEPLFGGAEGLYMPLSKPPPAPPVLPVQCHSLLPVLRALGACGEDEWEQVAAHLKARCPPALEPYPWWFGKTKPTPTHLRRAATIFNMSHFDKN